MTRNPPERRLFGLSLPRPLSSVTHCWRRRTGKARKVTGASERVTEESKKAKTLPSFPIGVRQIMGYHRHRAGDEG